MRIPYLLITLFTLLSLTSCTPQSGMQSQVQPTVTPIVQTIVTPTPTSIPATPTTLPKIKSQTKVVPTPTPTPLSTPTPIPTFPPTPTMETPYQPPQPESTKPPIAPAPPPPSSSDDSTPAPGQSDLENQLTMHLLKLINQDRANAGRSPYLLDATLNRVAHAHSVKMTDCGLSHACSGEPRPCDRVQNAGIDYRSCGENVGYAKRSDVWSAIEVIQHSMVTEEPPDDGHRRNLLSSSFHKIGLGVVIDSSGKVWVTEDFTN